MATESGQVVPDLETRVRPAPHLYFHWSAFGKLSTDRQLGFSIGPIPWTAIDRFADRRGIDDPDEYERFERLIGAMDRAFMTWHSEKRS